MSLDELRERIDGIDGKLLVLLNERAKCAQEIGQIKHSTDSAFYIPEREHAILNKIQESNEGPLSNEAVKSIYRVIISAIRALERRITVAFLGPLHTFSHDAALRIFGPMADYHPLPTVSDIFTEVECKRIDYGVVPTESSTGGGVKDTLDRFISSDLIIINELMLHIHQNLLSNCQIEKIEKIYSKDQAFVQCRDWLKSNIPNAELIDTSSTAEAARIASKTDGAAAIASELAARNYDIDLLVPRIEDAQHNCTRFFVVGHQIAKRTGNDKTSVIISVKDHPGALYEILLPLSKVGVNLTRIESRPSRKKAWEYVFFIDMLGHIDDENVKEALDKIKKSSIEAKVLGSYPRGTIEE